jgi:hypothetical protein
VLAQVVQREEVRISALPQKNPDVPVASPPALLFVLARPVENPVVDGSVEDAQEQKPYVSLKSFSVLEAGQRKRRRVHHVTWIWSSSGGSTGGRYTEGRCGK